MSDPSRPPCRPWLAGVLGVVAVGIGHFYAGHPLRGFVAWAGLSVMGTAVVVALLDPLPYPPWNVVVPVAFLLVVWLLLVRDAVACARVAVPWRPPWWMVAAAMATVTVVDEIGANWIGTKIGRAFTISSRSMEPGLALGDRILVDMRTAATAVPRRRDLVVFRYPVEPEKIWTKRIAGLPGETIEVRDKRLLVDGTETTGLPAVYVDADRTLASSARDTMPARTVEPNHYFMIGDNRDRSYDSRFWGTVPRADVLGTARVVYFSWDGDSSTVRWSRIGKVID